MRFDFHWKIIRFGWKIEPKLVPEPPRGTILVILEVPGEVLKFDWILGSPLGHPRLREQAQWRVKCYFVRPTNHQSQIADPQPETLNLQLEYWLATADLDRISNWQLLTHTFASQPGGPWRGRRIYVHIIYIYIYICVYLLRHIYCTAYLLHGGPPPNALQDGYGM